MDQLFILYCFPHEPLSEIGEYVVFINILIGNYKMQKLNRTNCFYSYFFLKCYIYTTGIYLLFELVVMKTLILSFLITKKIYIIEVLHFTCSFSEQEVGKNTEVDLKVSLMSKKTLELASIF